MNGLRVPGALPRCVLRDLLHEQVAARPDEVYAAFESGESWTFLDLLAQVREAAAGLAALGVRQGDFVALWLAHGPVALRTWFAVNYLGAVAVPVNLAYKGQLLARVLANSGVRLMVLESHLVERLEALAPADRARLDTLVTVGESAPRVPAGLRQVDEAALHGAGSCPPEPPAPIRPTDLQVILYTSGTTGPSKGVLCSYLHLWTSGHNVYFLTARDRYMVNLPLAHVSGILPCVLMLALGGSIAVVERFQTDRFWEQIRRCQATFVILLGAMAKFLLSQPASAQERGGPLTKMLLLPFDMPIEPMRERWGVDVYTSFNMTEVCCPIMSAPNPTALGSCGRLRPGIEARIADPEDFEVADGTVGELLLRTDQPWSFSHGYHEDPAATARAWRNGWFHTGDAFRRDAEGNFYFVDRLKDTIRRRGENISSFEVEAELLAFPAVQEAAVVAVPSELGEDEVMAVLTAKPGQGVDPAELIHFLVPRLPYFMIPRYVRVEPELPKTPTLKIEKHLLRQQGLKAPGIWDREQAGLRLGRNT
jgi:crotonobetaine/carnitine-CoA ligase